MGSVEKLVFFLALLSALSACQKAETSAESQSASPALREPVIEDSEGGESPGASLELAKATGEPSAADAERATELAARRRDDILTLGMRLYSQGNEELIIRHFFNDRRDGFFLDVGASHWKHASTTYYLEAHLGWSGIAVDARDEFAPAYAQHRPRTRFFSYLVTDHSGSLEPFYRSGHGIQGDLSSVRADNVELFPVEVELEEVQLPSITLNELLDQIGVTRIDLLSMDIEQSEPAALAGFDIDRFAPELVCIEATPTIRDEITRYFGEHDYERLDEYLAYDRINWYYRPKLLPQP